MALVSAQALTFGPVVTSFRGVSSDRPNLETGLRYELTEQSPFYAQAKLPTALGDFDLRVYREGELEHLAISCGDMVGAENLTVRIHSECLTSEVLGSLKCDCKAQLDTALQTIQDLGRGVVLYLRQEGRGIGLGNKIRAYRLQEEGVDTVDANRILGFNDDVRSYDVAAAILLALKVGSVRLMTNNPSKVEGLRASGIEVTGRTACVTGVNSVNRGYMETKRKRMGHLIHKDELDQDKVGGVLPG